jgi:antitoxin CcdA
MGRYVAVSAKIPEELKKRLRELNVNMSQLVRKALEEKIKLIEEENLKTLAAKASRLLKKIPSTEITRVIRKTRDEN